MSRLARYVDQAKFLATKHVKGFSVSPVPTFDPEGLAAFTDLIGKSRCYLEYGSGGSTIVASKSVPSVISVECDAVFSAAVRKHIARTDVKLIVVDIGMTGPWGYPFYTEHSPARLSKWRDYVDAPWTGGVQPDLVLVDGRFRVACSMKSLIKAPACTIMFDDYFDREAYRPIEAFATIERRGRMALLTKRSDFDVENCRAALQGFYKDFR